MLEFDDIQHILLTRTPAITGRYEFLTFDTPAGGRAWLSELIDRVQSATDAQATMDESDRWITLAFTWNGLRALGVPEDSLATFPDEFREGMAVAGRHPRRHRRQRTRALGRRPGGRRRACDRHPVLPHRRTEHAGRSPSTTSCSPAPTACAVCRTSI